MEDVVSAPAVRGFLSTHLLQVKKLAREGPECAVWCVKHMLVTVEFVTRAFVVQSPILE